MHDAPAAEGKTLTCARPTIRIPMAGPIGPNQSQIKKGFGRAGPFFGVTIGTVGA